MSKQKAPIDYAKEAVKLTTEDGQEILEAIIDIGVKQVSKTTIPDNLCTTISEKLIKQLTIEEMIEMGLVSPDQVLEEYYNQV